MTEALHDLGGLGIFMREVWRTLKVTKGNTRPVIQQMAFICYRSLSTIAFAGIFVGAILVLQFNLMLLKFEAQSFLGALNTSAVIREVGPLIISFLLAGKIGAFTAAELGTMRVTEQIDAIECLGTNPIQYLILPRFIAIILSSALLLLLGIMVSIGSSIVVADVFCGVNPKMFFNSMPKFTGFETFLGGLFKCLVYGVIVAGVSCHQGYTASGGARGVGRAVTKAAINTNLYIVLGNYASTQALQFFDNLAKMAREAWIG